MICRTTSLYDKNRTKISYDFYCSSDISLKDAKKKDLLHESHTKSYNFKSEITRNGSLSAISSIV